MINLLVILGPTASGKTSVAAHWACYNNGEIISADSRQVYRGMDIGTGKDYADCIVDGQNIKCHCIDIVEAGKQYNVYEYQKDFISAYEKIIAAGKNPVLCGGSGMYIEAAIKGYKLIKVPVNDALRNELNEKTDEELIKMLANMKKLHNSTDTNSRKRTIRAIEIETYQAENPHFDENYPDIRPLLIGIKFDRETQRRRISQRLRKRLDQGLVEEAQKLLDSGLTIENLEYYGLEYKFLAQYLANKLTYSQMFEQLNTAIHQFAKRQMTWFRRMERNGEKIFWIDGGLTLEEKMNKIKNIIF